MKHSLNEPPIALQYPCELLGNSVEAVPKNHVIKISNFSKSRAREESTESRFNQIPIRADRNYCNQLQEM